MLLYFAADSKIGVLEAIWVYKQCLFLGLGGSKKLLKWANISGAKNPQDQENGRTTKHVCKARIMANLASF